MRLQRYRSALPLGSAKNETTTVTTCISTNAYNTTQHYSQKNEARTTPTSFLILKQNCFSLVALLAKNFSLDLWSLAARPCRFACRRRRESLIYLQPSDLSLHTSALRPQPSHFSPPTSAFTLPPSFFHIPHMGHSSNSE